MHILLFQVFINFAMPYDAQTQREMWPGKSGAVVVDLPHKILSTVTMPSRSLWSHNAKIKHLTRFANARKSYLVAPDITHYNIRVDVARRGGTQRMYGFITDAHGVAAWMNPTVPNLDHNKHTLTVVVSFCSHT